MRKSQQTFVKSYIPEKEKQFGVASGRRKLWRRFLLVTVQGRKSKTSLFVIRINLFRILKHFSNFVYLKQLKCTFLFPIDSFPQAVICRPPTDLQAEAVASTCLPTLGHGSRGAYRLSATQSLTTMSLGSPAPQTDHQGSPIMDGPPITTTPSLPSSYVWTTATSAASKRSQSRTQNTEIRTFIPSPGTLCGLDLSLRFPKANRYNDVRKSRNPAGETDLHSRATWPAREKACAVSPCQKGSGTTWTRTKSEKKKRPDLSSGLARSTQSDSVSSTTIASSPGFAG
ncbi:hypothetical protein CEXT_629531 [Caerostris extrusa]|uniref:Uncharacterized protein n=1 Tax=Caerostris extrusa TaxID=172846 RepID=A0AAV4MCQ6_CAEEX|nr:hypothetical protein CEXT_629531 [Caerostris extrusa]